MTTQRPIELASRDEIREVQDELGLDYDTAERVADYVLRAIQEEAVECAQLVLLRTPNGDLLGPLCSWCHTLAGVCWHISHGELRRQEHLLALSRAGVLTRKGKVWHDHTGPLNPWMQTAADALHEEGHITAHGKRR